MKAALYLRVSTEEQTEAQTIQNQRDYLKAYCELNKIEVYEAYIDEAISGTLAFEDRPAGKRLLSDAEEKHFDQVIFYRIDRFSCSLRVLLETYQFLKYFNIDIRSASEPFDTSNPLGIFIMHMLASMAELDMATILERVSA